MPALATQMTADINSGAEARRAFWDLMVPSMEAVFDGKADPQTLKELAHLASCTEEISFEAHPDGYVCLMEHDGGAVTLLIESAN